MKPMTAFIVSLISFLLNVDFSSATESNYMHDNVLHLNYVIFHVSIKKILNIFFYKGASFFE